MTIDDADFQRALSFTLRAEGGFSDKATDAGGRTDHGITQSTYSAWLKKHNMPSEDVANITDAKVEIIYDEFYWIPSGCIQLPPDLAMCVFDWSVTSGVGKAVSKLQRLTGAPAADGIWGVETLRTVEECIDAADEHTVCRQYLQSRDLFFSRLAAQDPAHGAPNLKGWLARNKHLRQAIGI